LTAGAARPALLDRTHSPRSGRDQPEAHDEAHHPAVGDVVALVAHDGLVGAVQGQVGGGVRALQERAERLLGQAVDHLVQDVHHILIAGFFHGLDDEDRVFALRTLPDLLHQYFPDAGGRVIRYFHFGILNPGVVVNLVLFAEQNRSRTGFFYFLLIILVLFVLIGHVQLHRFGLAERGGKHKEGNQQESQVHHRGHVNLGRNFLRAFLLTTTTTTIYLCHCVLLVKRLGFSTSNNFASY